MKPIIITLNYFYKNINIILNCLLNQWISIIIFKTNISKDRTKMKRIKLIN